MTHFYELYKRVPRARRKELAKFIHELKCMCGRKYHVHVLEMLENCEEDYLSIDTTKLVGEVGNEFEKELLDLADEYAIPRKKIDYFSEPYYTNEEGYCIYLYTDF